MCFPLRLLRIAALLISARAFALDPHRASSEYVLDQWGADQKFQLGAIQSVAQTPDGFLWVAGETGLFRFDGASFQPMSGRDASLLPAGPVQQLAVDSSGDLWVLGRNMSLFRFHAGTFQNVLQQLLHFGKGATAMGVGPLGQVVFWTGSTGYWCAAGGSLQILQRDVLSRHNFLVISLVEAPQRQLWIGSRDTGLISLQAGHMRDYSGGLPDLKVNAMMAERNSTLLIGTDGGAVRWDGLTITQSGVPDALRRKQIVSLAKDREGNTWVGTDDALYRITQAGDAAPVQPARIGGVHAIFEDREGNLWLGTDQGLARLRDSLFLSYPLPVRSRSRENSSPVYVDGEGRTWYSTGNAVLRWRNNAATGDIQAGTAADTIYAIAGREREIWVGTKAGRLLLLRCTSGCRVEREFGPRDGLPRDAVTSLFAARDGSIWIGSASSGVSELQGGTIRNVQPQAAAGKSDVRSMAQTHDGTLWVGTAAGLSAIHDGTWRSYDASAGLPPGGVNSLEVDSEGILWIGGPYGLSFYRDGRFEHVQAFTNGEQILGVAAQHGFLWIVTPARFLLLKRSIALHHSVQPSDIRQFTGVDGFLTGSVGRRSPTVTSDSLGRVWLSTSRGLSVVNPSRLSLQEVPALPQIRTVTADGVPLAVAKQVQVPALSKRVSLEFIGLSLTAPDRVQYQYKLENFDAGWSDAVSVGEAVYTNLLPGAYRFRVRATNSAGLWSGLEAAVDLQVAAAAWQTWWFKLFCALSLGALVATAYLLRLSALRRRLDLSFQERLSERTRIAQDLHDTLLQGFLSASMQLHVANHRLEESSPAKAPLRRAAELMRKAGDEGRAALRQLRSEDDSTTLQDAFSAIPHEAMIDEDVRFTLRVEGSLRAVRKTMFDDIYRIGREAIINAIRHAGATGIEVEVCYEPNQLRVTVRDDGCGIDPEIIRSGREGHWGVRGMRERAARMNSRLTLRSQPGAGTDVTLQVPASLAYQPEQRNSKRYLLDRFASHRRTAAGDSERHGRTN